jgi:hypothetical protein
VITRTAGQLRRRWPGSQLTIGSYADPGTALFATDEGMLPTPSPNRMTPRPLISGLRCGLLLVALGACSPADRSAQHSTTRDSAGIAIVESTGPTWQERQAWTIDSQPMLTIGSMQGAPEYELYRASSAARLSDGRIVVANGGTNELRFFDRSGRHTASIGRTGEGPGEFRDLQRVWTLTGDSLLVYDFMPARLSVFSPAGEFVRSFHISSAEGRQVIVRGPFADGSLLVVGAPIWGRAGATTGVVRDSVPYFLYNREGELMETLGFFPSVEVYRIVTGESWRLTGVPFARAPIVAVGARSYVYGAADSYELREYNLNGSVDRILRIDHAAPSISNDDVAEYRRDRLERAEQEGTRPAMERLLSELPFPATLPPYERAVLDEEENLWIADYRVTRSRSATWKVFSARGDFMGSVAAPPQLEIVQIGRDFVLGQWIDEWDVEHIRMYRLNKP